MMTAPIKAPQKTPVKAPTTTPTAPTTVLEGIEMSSLTERCCVEALNNDVSTVQDVIRVFVRVCGYDLAKAKAYTLKIHVEGRAVCFWGSKERCQRVIRAFRVIGVDCNLLEN